MHCASQRALSDTQKLSDGVKVLPSKTSLGKNNLGTSLKDFKICSQVYRSTQNRCTVLTFLTLKSDGHWRVVALPVLCPEHKNCVEFGALLNVDDLHPVSPQLIRLCKIDKFQVLKGPPLDVNYSNLSSTIFLGLNWQGQSRGKALTDRENKSYKICRKSSFDNLFTYMDSPLLIPHGSGSTHLPDVFIESFKLDGNVRKNSAKKARKKGKHNKKFPGSLGLEVSEEYANGNLISKVFDPNDDGTLSCATSQELTLLDGRVNGNSFALNYSETPACTSSSDGIRGEGLELSERYEVENTYNVRISCCDDMYSHGVSDMHEMLVLDAISAGSNSDAQNSCCGDLHLKGVSDMCNSLVLDSVSAGSNGDGRTNASHDVKSSKHVSSGVFVSEVSKVCLSHGNLLNDAVDGCHQLDRSKCSQGSSSDMQSDVPDRRGKQSKMVSRSSTVHRVGSVGSSYGHTGKENNHSVWQKVQQKDVDGCAKQLKKDINFKDAPLLKRNGNAAPVNMPQKEKTSKKSKRKMTQASKQEVYLRNKSPANSFSQVSIIQQNEISDVSSQVDQKGWRSVSRSHSQIGCPKVGLEVKRVECMSTESIHSQPVCPDEVEPYGGVCKSVSQDMGNPDGIFVKPSESLGQSDPLRVRSPMYLPHLIMAGEVAQTVKESSLSENSKQNHSSGSVLQKWVPVGSKNSGITMSSRFNSSPPASGDEPMPESWTVKHILPEKGASGSQDDLPKNVGVECMGQSYRKVDCSSHNQECQTQNNCLSACKVEEDGNHNLDARNCSSAESRDQNIGLIETDSSKLVEAVNHACEVQLASEAVQVATGGPIAEFERLLHYTSPVVSELQSTLSCQTCQKDKIGDALLCRHEIPNISLGCLWQWYEKHGSYGLEVKAEDCKTTKRLGVDNSAFRAYFVPLLSAIQLFSNSKSQSMSTDNSFIGVDVMEAHVGDTTSERTSDAGHLTMDVGGTWRHMSEHISEMPSASAQDHASLQSADKSSSNDPELLFEYFELEQPQQRQPLYEKITELVRAGGPSRCKIYGDPTKLNSFNLHDLHPRSWYSVAWYPIYRIPDGNFRAAFLTYHSLGHLTHRRPKFDSPDAGASIISPVVGLQSYNAQGECWFQMRHSALGETPGLNPSAILKERLRALEETASLMARAVVKRGNVTSVNRHPDYEFFLSRRRS